MASIQSLGIGSGLLTSELLEQLVEAERAPAVARLDSDQAIAEARLEALGEVKSALSTLNSSIRGLTSLSAFNASQVTSSNSEALSATASSVAESGSYSVQVGQLAQQHSIVSQSYESTSEAIGVGTLTFRFGTTDIDGSDVYQGFTVNEDAQSRAITIDSSNNTLAGIRDAINDADFGVQATIVDDGSGYRLLMTSEQGGAENSLEITASGAAALSVFDFNQSSQSMEQTQAAQDAEFTVNGLNISRDNNLVAGVIPGVTLNLKAATAGPVTLSISKDPGELVEKVQGVVDNYNALKTMADVLTAFDPDAGDNGQGSVLSGDRALRTAMNSVNNALRSFSLGNTYGSLAEVGVTTNQFNDYLMEFDAAEFRAAFADDPQAVTALFATTGQPSDDDISFITSSTATQPGSYDVEVTRMATAGRYEGISVDSLASGNITIDDSNNQFNILVNGVEVDISLTEGDYATADLLAEEVQRQINSHSDLRSSANSVTVSYNASESRMEMTSNRYGKESVIRMISIDSAAAATLGLVEEGQGPYQGLFNSALATTTGNSSDPLNAAMTVDSDTQFSVSINGVDSGLLTLPGDAGTPVTYNTADELITAVESLLDGAFAGEGIDLTVGYEYDADSGTAGLTISTGSAGDEIVFGDVNLAAATRLGFVDGNAEPVTSIRGLNVAGTINGLQAEGNGQVLTASDGITPATSGYYLNAPFGDLSTSTSGDEFRLRVDGTLSGTISLGVIAVTDPDNVADLLTNAINNDPALLAAGAAVAVTYDADSGGFRFTSQSRGEASQVSVASLSGNAGTVFGLVTGSGAQSASGTKASGDADPASGIRLRITDGAVGSRGTIDFFRGLASQTTELIDSMFASDGLMTGRTDSLNLELERIAEKRVELAERLAATESRLQASFFANDIIISNFNSTMDFLEAQLPMLEALASGREQS